MRPENMSAPGEFFCSHPSSLSYPSRPSPRSALPHPLPHPQ